MYLDVLKCAICIIYILNVFFIFSVNEVITGRDPIQTSDPPVILVI